MIPRRLNLQRMRRTLGAASCVRGRPRFVARELGGRAAAGRYQLREAELVAHVRHPLLDMWVLEEVFRFKVYEPPEPVVASLDRLGHPLRILDLGGHVGFFGLFMRSRYPEAQVVSFEPDPGNAQVLRRTIEANGLERDWRLIEASAGTSEGQVELRSSFHLTKVSSASDRELERLQRGIGQAFPFLRETPLLRSEPHSVSELDVFPYLAQTDLAKLDIEGSEWAILADPRLEQLSARAVVLEYHPGYLPAGDPERVVVDALARAGYVADAPRRRHDAGTIWAWRP